MDITTHRSLDSVVCDTVKLYIEKAAQKIAEEYKEKALKDLDEAVRKAVTDTAVHFSKMIQVKDMGEQIVITISDKRA